jgi:hypothetical protein
MALMRLSADAIGAIIAYLDGCTITRLAMSGNQVLAAKLSASIASLRFSLRRFSKFPSSSFKYPLLRDFELVMVKHHQYYPLCDGPLLGCMLAHKRLQKLVVSSPGSFELLSPSTAAPSLAQLFPCLQTLRLNHSTSYLTGANLEALPPTVTILELLAISNNATLILKLPSSRFFSLIPPLLEELNINGVVLQSEKETQPAKAPTWPPNLKSLYYGTIQDFSLIKQLPASLKILRTSLGHGQNDQQILFSSALPQQLENVELHGHGHFDFDSPLPPSLTRWFLTLDVVRTTSPEPPPLPPTLHVYIDPFHRKLGLRSTFPELRDLAFIITDFDHANWTELPQRLHTLCIRGFLNGTDQRVPYHLLPRSVTELWVPFDPEADLAQFPPNLKEFRFLPSLLPPVPGKLIWDRLPSKMSALFLPFHALSNSSDMALFPSSLTHLRLFVPHSIQAQFNNGNLSDFGKYVPSQLTTLSLDHRGNRPNEPYTWDFVRHIPRNVQELTLPGGRMDRSDLLLLLPLPPNLCQLAMHGHDSTLNVATDAHFACLPASLTSLTLSGYWNGLTPDILPLLPPFLHTVDVPNLKYDTLGPYFDAPHWRGHALKRTPIFTDDEDDM